MSDAKILIVQNDEEATRLAERLRGFGNTACTTVSCGRRAIEIAACERPDVALVDLSLDGELSGVDVGEQLGCRFDVPLVYLTDDVETDLLRLAEATQPYGCVAKPADARQARLSIKTALAMHEKELRRRSHEAEFHETINQLLGKIRLMETIFESMDEAIFVATPDSHLAWANSRMEEMLGVGVVKERPEDWGRLYGVYYPDQTTMVPTDQLVVMHALRGEALDDVELFVRNEKRPAGIHISARGRPLRDDNGEIQAGVVVFRDITEYKRTLAELETTIHELRTQTRLMQTVFDNMEEGVVVADKTGNFLLTNQRREEIVGLKMIASEPAEWPVTFGAFYLDEKTHFPTDQLPIVRAMRGEVTEDVEIFVRNEQRPQGAYLRARGRPLLDQNQQVIAGVAIFSDVTKYKRTETELAQTIQDLQSQAQIMETVFESIGDGVIAADPEGRFTIINSSAQQIVGTGMLESSPEQWTQQYGIFHVDGQTPFPSDQLPLLHAMQGKATDDLEMFIRNEERPDGVFISVNGRPLQKNAEGYGGGVITFRDVTNRKMAEAELGRAMQELREQSELMEATFNGISDGLVVVNTEGELLNANPAGRQIASYETLTPEDARLVRKWATYYYPDRETLIPPEALALNRAIFHGEAVRDQTMFVRSQSRPDGFFVRISVQPLRDAEGGIRGAVSIFRDVTDQMREEEALVQAFAQGRLEMIDTILHNIGNALSSVLTGVDTLHQYLTNNPFLPRLRALADAVNAHRDDWADFVARDPQGRKVMPFIVALAGDLTRHHDEMVNAAKRVQDRTHHIADIIRTQRALDSPHMVRKDLVLENAIQAAAKVLRDSLDRRGVALEIDCGNAPREIRVQESRFHQMMVNLIKNAMEAIDDLAAVNGLVETPRIGIRTYVEGDFLRLDVTDNGIGIEGTNTSILFAAGYTTKKSGSGLGLHSAANFVIGMGGRIQALSEGTGKGSTLRVMLRLASLAMAPAKPAEITRPK
ncbi:MAG: PAS domain S-box protein [Candidatus Tectomicrobia bacterium]|nr:PAS domain S-box protein [Candidatus Tectomicrobia bacterium]